MEFEILENEYWWGGNVIEATKMPFDRNTEYFIDLSVTRRTQTAPLFLSNKGRYLWSEEAFKITFSQGKVTVETDFEVILNRSGSTLRDAYLAAMKNHFPFPDNIHTPREFYKYPMFNTWMELIKNQNQLDIVKYAKEIIENGYNPGILIIDGGWQIRQGTWEFNHDLIPDPKGLIDSLHNMGFVVMIWVSPFVCPEGDNFLELFSERSSEFLGEKYRYNHLLRHENGEVAIHHWWSGYGAYYNFLLEDDCKHMANQLDSLMEKYGIDGFKFDGGTYHPKTFVAGTEFYGGYSTYQLNMAWMKFASSYKFHEVKDSWKQCGKNIIQRLADKNHSWDTNGLNCLIPHGCFVGLIGSPFICPDMVGGGEWTAFVYGKHDEELFVRMAQCSALFPMMQFSSLPWRHLSKEAQEICFEAAKLHEKMYTEIEKILASSERSGEPIIRHMEYQFPDCGFEKVNSQFMLGDNILVAPVVEQGQCEKKVFLPLGKWEEQNSHTVYDGGAAVTVPAPISVLPWFKKVD